MSENESSEDLMEWEMSKKAGKKRKEPGRDEIRNIIGISQTDEIRQPTKKVPTEQNINMDKETQKTNLIKNKHKNFSAKMLEIVNKPYNHLFYINTNQNITNRIQMADIWDKEQPNAKDIIIQTKKGFLLKSNSPKVIITNHLERLKTRQLITNFNETNPNMHKPKTVQRQESYSAIVSQVELVVQDNNISEHLTQLGIEHRFCKRIIARATGNPTSYIRIITGSINSYEKLLNEGVFYKKRHYPVYASAPPDPTPIPCNKCLQFTHKTEDCNTPIKCKKCGDNHNTNKCTTNLPPKCNACGAEDHQAWAFKCPKRPTKPIEGIPNVTIKSLNKKSQEIKDDKKKNTKIHSKITIHDHIINTYLRKLNKPKNTNREELIQKLKKRFINEFNVDTSIVFTGNRALIFMFDLDDPNSISPTEPKQGDVTTVQIHRPT